MCPCIGAGGCSDWFISERDLVCELELHWGVYWTSGHEWMQVEDHPNHQEALLGRAETQKVAPPVSSVRTASSSTSLPLHGISRQATALQASDN